MFGDPETNSLCLPISYLNKIGENLDSKRIPITGGDRKQGIYPYYGASGIVDYVDDYIFERTWHAPRRYALLLSEFKAAMTPDFSLFTDYPRAVQIYNHYRKHWLAAYWQLHGLTVYPTISWSDEQSYDWCFDGEPVGGIVAVSSVGTQQNKESKRLFLRGYEEMMKRLDPKFVIFYGHVPLECDWNVIRVKPHYDEIVKRRKANEISVSAGTP